MICLAVVQGVDNYYYSFHEKQSFVDFCETHYIHDKILVILQGGSDKIFSLNATLAADWML